MKITDIYGTEILFKVEAIKAIQATPCGDAMVAQIIHMDVSHVIHLSKDEWDVVCKSLT